MQLELPSRRQSREMVWPGGFDDAVTAASKASALFSAAWLQAVDFTEVRQSLAAGALPARTRQWQRFFRLKPWRGLNEKRLRREFLPIETFDAK